MSRYQELREYYAALKQREAKLIEQNCILSSSIVAGLPDYLGMPRCYSNSSPSEPNNLDRYLRLFKVGDDCVVSQEVRHLSTAITYTWDGRFRFGLGIVLETAQEVFPKDLIWMVVNVRRGKDEASIEISDRIVQVERQGSNWMEIEKVHRLIHELLRDYVTQGPGVADSMPRIGFGVPGSRTD